MRVWGGEGPVVLEFLSTWLDVVNLLSEIVDRSPSLFDASSSLIWLG